MPSGTQYRRKQFYVIAKEVKAENMQELANECRGRIKNVNGKDYIKVPVKGAVNDRQEMAFAGDWLLLSDSGYKVYSDKAFKASFELVGPVVTEEMRHDAPQVVNVFNAAVGEPMGPAEIAAATRNNLGGTAGPR